MSATNPGIRWYKKLVSDSTAEPVATTDFKRQINLPSTYFDDDNYIEAIVTGARKLAEAKTGRAFINQTWDLVLDRFPCGNYPLTFPVPPLGSITSITYYDSANSSTTLSSSDYILNQPYSTPAFIVPAIDRTWPATQYRADAVTVRFVAGYGASATSVPIQARHAIKMLAAHWYENREAAVLIQGGAFQEPPESVQALLGSLNWGYYA